MQTLQSIQETHLCGSSFTLEEKKWNEEKNAAEYTCKIAYKPYSHHKITVPWGPNFLIKYYKIHIFLCCSRSKRRMVLRGRKGRGWGVVDVRCLGWGWGVACARVRAVCVLTFCNVFLHKEEKWWCCLPRATLCVAYKICRYTNVKSRKKLHPRALGKRKKIHQMQKKRPD